MCINIQFTATVFYGYKNLYEWKENQLIITLFKTAVANNSSYFFGSKWGRFIRCGWLDTPLWSKNSGILKTSSMILSTKCLRFECDWSMESVSFSPVGRPVV